MNRLRDWSRLRPTIDALELVAGVGLVLWGISEWSVPLAAIAAGAGLLASRLLTRRS
jgi:hypothetical protein